LTGIPEEVRESSAVLTVRELVRSIRSRLEENFSSIWVTGEVSNLRTPLSGHTYFTLKDTDAQIQSVFFKHKKRYIRFEPEDGMQVLCKGSVTVYETRGTVQLNVDYMEPVGLGALHLAFEQTKKKLEKEGLFDPGRKKRIPLIPGRIGVVTSPTGAAIRDILNIINRRFANVEILIVPVRVQGEAAIPEIVDALERLNRRADIDVILLTRGGGSLEDLWPFNEETVARAVFASEIPVISAVGHETDFTISDFVADLRVPTPSAAAELVVRNKSELEEKLIHFHRFLGRQIRSRLDRSGSILDLLTERLVSPEQKVGLSRQRLDDLNDTLSSSIRNRIGASRERLRTNQATLRLLSPFEKIRRLRDDLQHLRKRGMRGATSFIERHKRVLASFSSRLEALSPLNVLARGYSVVTRLPGKEIVLNAREISVTDRLHIRFHRGEAECTVDRIDAETREEETPL